MLMVQYRSAASFQLEDFLNETPHLPSTNPRPAAGADTNEHERRKNDAVMLQRFVIVMDCRRCHPNGSFICDICCRRGRHLLLDVHRARRLRIGLLSCFKYRPPVAEPAGMADTDSQKTDRKRAAEHSPSPALSALSRQGNAEGCVSRSHTG